MSLFGSLYASVSGIQSQGTAIGIISDNIANVSTIGYKAGSQYFSTLVTNSGSTTSYSPGGVRAQNRQLVSQQGLVQATNSPLDLAISGSGFFVVQDSLKASDNPTTSYTRAGAFKTDSLGNFVNASGLYLKAWPLDSNGSIPANNASLDSLQVVNIGAASGNAAATTKVDVGINLNSSKPAFSGSGAIAKPGSDLSSGTTQNVGIKSDGILAPNTDLVSGDDMSITVNGSLTYNFRYGGFAPTTDIVAGAGIFGVNDANSAFATGIAAGDKFTVALSGGRSSVFTYVTSGANAANGTFSSLQTLSDAINVATGLTSRIVSSGATVKMYIAGEDAREGITVTNGVGNTANFVTSLGYGVAVTTATPVATAASGINRFATLDGLNSLINSKTSGNVASAVVNPEAAASLNVTNTNPLTSIKFANVTGGTSDFLKELGVTNALIPASYDPTSPTRSMSSLNVPATSARQVRVYDSLGEGHDLTISFLKVANGTWRTEIYASNAADVASGNKQIAAGQMTFNTDGTLASVDSTITTAVSAINWSNGATSANIDFNFGKPGPVGTVGNSDGMRQYANSDYVYFINQNGSEAGLLDSVSIDKSGYVIANFNNGQTQRLYKIPLADFANPDDLSSRNGNTFTQTYGSGEVNLKEPGTSGAGAISPSSLESANTELSEELTDMIVAQRAYQASAKVITTASQLLDELNRLNS